MESWGGTSHHHLAMVVVEMGFVLERITDDEYGSSGTGEARDFQRDLDRASFEGGVFILRAERKLKGGRKRGVLRNRDGWKKKRKKKNTEQGWKGEFPEIEGSGRSKNRDAFTFIRGHRCSVNRRRRRR